MNNLQILYNNPLCISTYSCIMFYTLIIREIKENKMKECEIKERIESLESFREGFKAVIFIALFAGFILALCYGFYNIGWIEGKWEGVKRMDNYNKCVYNNPAHTYTCFSKEVDKEH